MDPVTPKIELMSRPMTIRTLVVPSGLVRTAAETLAGKRRNAHRREKKILFIEV